jgi:hypothetical protein
MKTITRPSLERIPMPSAENTLNASEHFPLLPEKAAAILLDAWRILQRTRAKDGWAAQEAHHERP